MLQVNNLVKSFGKRENKQVVLSKVSFTLPRGQITGFLGANGAGKTTLIKIILGFMKPDSGDVVLFNSDKKRKDLRKRVGYLPEKPTYYMNLTGRQYLSYLGSLNSIAKGEVEERAHYWGEKIKICYAYDKKLSNYSKGMLQRLGLVSSLLHGPELIILDEPLSGLDPVGRQEVKDVITEVNQKHGTTVFFSSHIVPDLEEISNNIVILKNGLVSELNSLTRKYSDKNMEYTIFYRNKEFSQYKKNVRAYTLSSELAELESEGAFIEKVLPKENITKIIYE